MLCIILKTSHIYHLVNVGILEQAGLSKLIYLSVYSLFFSLNMSLVALFWIFSISYITYLKPAPN